MTTTGKLPKPVGLCYFTLGPFLQNDREIVLDDGTTYPPTYNWISNLTAVRVKDQQSFFVKVTIPDGRKNDLQFFAQVIENGLSSLEHYAMKTPLSRKKKTRRAISVKKALENYGAGMGKLLFKTLPRSPVHKLMQKIKKEKQC